MSAEEDRVRSRLEYLRGELRAERMSWGELAELQALAPYIDEDDVELREAAGLPEFPMSPEEMVELAQEQNAVDPDSTIVVSEAKLRGLFVQWHTEEHLSAEEIVDYAERLIARVKEEARVTQ